MNIKPIRTEKDYEEALTRLREIWDCEDGTPESDELDVLASLIESYGSRHYPFEPVHPLDQLKYELEELGVSSEVTENILNRIGLNSISTNVVVVQSVDLDQK